MGGKYLARTTDEVSNGTLEQVNALLALRGKPAVAAEELNEAFDFAMGFYGIPYDALTSETPRPQDLVLGIALLAAQAPFTQAATPAITSKEVSGNAGSIKTQYAAAPVDPYPVIGGLLNKFSAKRTGGVSFGVSSR